MKYDMRDKSSQLLEFIRWVALQGVSLDSRGDFILMARNLIERGLDSDTMGAELRDGILSGLLSEYPEDHEIYQTMRAELKALAERSGGMNLRTVMKYSSTAVHCGLHEIRGRNKYCGPSALAAITGLSTDICARYLRIANEGLSNRVKGIETEMVTPALAEMGYETETRNFGDERPAYLNTGWSGIPWDTWQKHYLPDRRPMILAVRETGTRGSGHFIAIREGWIADSGDMIGRKPVRILDELYYPKVNFGNGTQARKPRKNDFVISWPEMAKTLELFVSSAIVVTGFSRAIVHGGACVASRG